MLNLFHYLLASTALVVPAYIIYNLDCSESHARTKDIIIPQEEEKQHKQELNSYKVTFAFVVAYC